MASAVEICLAQEAKLKDTQVKENAVRFNPTTYLFERWTGSAWTPVGSSIDESNLVHKTGNETISGTKTFNDTIVGSVSGNSGASDKATKLATARSINVTDGTNNGTAAIFDGSGDASIKLPSTIKATLDGNAGSATKLATARTIRTNLSSASTASFDGSANVTPGVTGILPVANGGTGNSTGKAPSAVTADSAVKDGAGNTIADTYLPLSGGTVTGTIRLSNNGEVGLISVTDAGATDYRCVILSSRNADNNYGGNFQAFAADSPNIPGYFLCRAQRQDTLCDLVGTPDGGLYFNNHALIHVAETWASGASWYRKWSDGWIEQGGQIGAMSPNTAVSISFNTPFATTNYYVAVPNISYDSDLSSAAAWYIAAINFTSTTSFVAVAVAHPRRWYACGY